MKKGESQSENGIFFMDTGFQTAASAPNRPSIRPFLFSVRVRFFRLPFFPELSECGLNRQLRIGYELI